MEERSSQSNPRKAARQVWILAGLGLLGGVITLVIFGLTLRQIRLEREAVDEFLREAAAFVSASESRLNEGQSELVTLLNMGGSSGPADEQGDWLGSMRGLVERTHARGVEPRIIEDLATFGEQLETMVELRAACLEWRAARESARETMHLAHASTTELLGVIQDAIIKAEGEQRLRRVMDIRRYRAAEGDDASTRANEIIEDVASTAGLGTIRSELAEVGVLCERLANQADLDRLSDLKDNKFRSSLARLRRELNKLMQADESIPIHETSMASFEASLFGAGFEDDTDHQTIKPGTGGLYVACADYLELMPVRDRLIVRVERAFREIHVTQATLEDHAQLRGQELAARAETRLASALRNVVIIGAIIAAVFAVLAARIAGQIRRQVLRLAESDLESRLVHGSAEMAAQTESFDDALQHVIDLVCELTDWPVGHAYEPDPKDPKLLRPTKIWHIADGDRFASFRDVTEKTSFHEGEGLPGRILVSGEPAWIPNVQVDDNFPRNRLASDLGVKGAFGFPVRIRGELVAVLEFFSTSELDSDPRLLQTMRNVAAQLSRVFERKRASEELEKARVAAEAANRAKSEFLSNMSHELRTPLNGVLGYAQILRRDPAATQMQREALDSIENCGQHLLTLINDVLDLSKIEAGRLEIVTEAVDLHRLLKSVFDIITPRGEAKGLEVVLKVSPEVPIGIVTDGTKLKQTLINLLGNAVKFTELGSVELDVRDVGDDILQFVISDTGIGMTPDELDGIFDPFKQAEGGKTVGGTGLGLAISKRIIEAEGGALLVESVRGEGSRFTIRIPLIEASDKEMTAVQEETLLEQHLPVLAEGQDVTILVVDDRPANRDILVQLLESAGFKTMQAEDGQIALNRLAEQRVPLVLMDVRMPVMNGIDATRAIREDEDLRDITVIAVTASVFPDFKQRIAEAGFDDFVGKPFRAAEIFAKIEHHLDIEFRESEASREVAAAAPILGPERASDIAARLREALRVKNVSAMNTLAAELIGADDAKPIGEQIAGLARAFDFAGMETLCADLEAVTAAPEDTGAAAGGDLDPDLAADIARRLREALKVKNVTALNTLAGDLGGRTDDAVAVGDRIAGLARAFDFAGLDALAVEMEAAAATAS